MKEIELVKSFLNKKAKFSRHFYCIDIHEITCGLPWAWYLFQMLFR